MMYISINNENILEQLNQKLKEVTEINIAFKVDTSAEKVELLAMCINKRLFINVRTFSLDCRFIYSFYSLPPEIGKLVNLKELHLNYNNLSRLR